MCSREYGRKRRVRNGVQMPEYCAFAASDQIYVDVQCCGKFGRGHGETLRVWAEMALSETGGKRRLREG